MRESSPSTKLKYALALLSLACPTISQATECQPYEPARVTLVGKLSMNWGYGPPGFREDPAHDQKEQYALLALKTPICVSGGDDDGVDVNVPNIGAVQLVPDHGQKVSKALLGHQVSVIGQLFHRISGGHTEVMISYSKVEAAH